MGEWLLSFGLMGFKETKNREDTQTLQNDDDDC